MKKLLPVMICLLFLAACNNSGEKKGEDSDSQYYYVDPGDSSTAPTDSITIPPRSDTNEAVKLKFPDKKNK